VLRRRSSSRKALYGRSVAALAGQSAEPAQISGRAQYRDDLSEVPVRRHHLESVAQPLEREGR
jgi:hypothetical protein